jgi:hypothetical protein
MRISSMSSFIPVVLKLLMQQKCPITVAGSCKFTEPIPQHVKHTRAPAMEMRRRYPAQETIIGNPTYLCSSPCSQLFIFLLPWSLVLRFPDVTKSLRAMPTLTAQLADFFTGFSSMDTPSPQARLPHRRSLCEHVRLSFDSMLDQDLCN